MTRVIAFVVGLIAILAIVWAVGASFFKDSPKLSERPAINVKNEFPDRDENETAARVLAIVGDVENNTWLRSRTDAVDYIRREISSPVATVEAPPKELATALETNGKTIGTLRAVLASNPPPVWKMRADNVLDPPEAPQILSFRLFAWFAADALFQRSRGNDAAAWTDVGAMWMLDQSLWARPETSSVMSALTGSRIITAVASKLPAPAPKWWSDFVAFDARRPFLRALAYDAWAAVARAERYPLGEPQEHPGIADDIRHVVEPVFRPIAVADAASRGRGARDASRAILNTPCQPLPDVHHWASTIRRLNRFIIEREGVSKLIAAQEQRKQSGEWPATIDGKSSCHNVQWQYTRTGSAMELRFTGQLPAAETRIVVPLTYQR